MWTQSDFFRRNDLCMACKCKLFMHMTRDHYSQTHHKHSPLPEKCSRPCPCPKRECTALETTIFSNRQSLEVKTASLYDTFMMSIIDNKGLSSFAFEMEMDDPDCDPQASMLAVSPSGEHSSICTIQMWHILQRLCNLSDRLSLFCDDNANE